MKKHLQAIVIFTTFLLLSCTFNAKQESGQLTEAYSWGRFYKRVKANYHYLIYLPDGYREAKPKSLPLILFLHGSMERGNNLDLVKKNAIPDIITQIKEFKCILIAPQCEANSFWNSDRLSALLKDVIYKYKIDPSRIYLTGISMGGYGCWQLAKDYPDYFAAVAPVCGGGQYFDAIQLKNIPVWAFHGANDSIVPVWQSEIMVEAINKSGGNAKLTIYEKTGHDAWNQAYQERDLFQWFFANQKKNIR